MILDAQLLLSDAQAITATAVSANVIDLKLAGISLGTGEDLYLHLNVDTAFTDVGSDSTVTVTVITDDNAAMSSAATIQTVGTFAALSPAGRVLIAKLQPSAAYERYIALNYTVAGGNLTTGAVTAALVKDVSDYKAYADNIVIS